MNTFWIILTCVNIVNLQTLIIHVECISKGFLIHLLKSIHLS